LSSPDLLKAFMREAAQQVYVVTARWGGRYSAFTASSVTSISLRPPLIMVAVDRSSLSHDPLVNSEYFAVTLLSFDDVEIARVMAEPVDPRVKLGKVGFIDEFEAPLLSIARPYILL
jgi:flavin reductase (DIM6/NTAB) family NADH-FMN oxidoreductase RutF